jgi:hypothetical protein
MFQFEFIIENTDTSILVNAETYKGAMEKVQSAKVPSLNLAELILMKMIDLDEDGFIIDLELEDEVL